MEWIVAAVTLVVVGCGNVPRGGPRIASAPHPLPDPPAPRPHAVAISVGWDFGCALLSDRTVSCWPNSNGPLYGSPVPGVADAVQLSVHEFLGCARRGDGRILCWGDTGGGRRGAGAALTGSTTVVEGIDDAIDLAVGQGSACALRRSGEVLCWGDLPTHAVGIVDHPVRLDGPTGVERIQHDSLDEFYAYSSGDVWAWTPQHGPERIDPAARGPTFTVTDGVLRSTRYLVPAGVGPVVAAAWDSQRACALESDGEVVCFDQWEAPGRDPRVRRWSFAGATQIAIGGRRVCVLQTAGEITCWSDDTDDEPRLVRVAWEFEPYVPSAPPGRAVQVAVGWAHGCARHESGAVRCWGSDDHGQRGDGPAEQDGSTWVLGDAVDIAAGYQHACAIRRGGAVVCWGTLDATSPAPPVYTADLPRVVEGIEDATAITARGTHTCALARGHVYCWGSGRPGPPGAGSRSLVEIPGIDDAIAIRAFARGVVVVRRDGRIWLGAQNELGPFAGARDAVVHTEHPPLACVLTDRGLDCGAGPIAVRSVAADDGYLCVARTDGVSCDRHGAGLELVPGLSGAVAIDVSEQHGCAAMADGEVRCWGRPRFGGPRGWLGVPLDVEGATEVFAALGGGCVRAAGGGGCWGALSGLAPPPAPASPVVFDDGHFGLCGLVGGRLECTGAASDGPLPRIPGGASMLALSDSPLCGCAVVSGAAHCWNHSRAVLTRLRDVHAIAVSTIGGELGRSDACAIVSGGLVRCVSLDGRSPSGTSFSLTRRVPWPVRGVERAVEIVAGEDAFHVRLEDGTLRCWGEVPCWASDWSVEEGFAVEGLTGVRAVRASGGYACAIRADGTVACWGRTDDAGVLGEGLLEVITPRTIEGLTNVVDLALAPTHACARFADGTARCWGARDAGDSLGDDGASGPRVIPLPAGTPSAAGSSRRRTIDSTFAPRPPRARHPRAPTP